MYLPEFWTYLLIIIWLISICWFCFLFICFEEQLIIFIFIFEISIKKESTINRTVKDDGNNGWRLLIIYLSHIISYHIENVKSKIATIFFNKLHLVFRCGHVVEP